MTSSFETFVVRSLHLRWALVVGMLLAAALVAKASEALPNVVVILSDDHSASFVGSYGNRDVRTPHLDQLAREGMRFERFYTSAPQCVPSRATLLTGRSPVGIGMTRFSAPLPREIPTFLELMRARKGYVTGVIGRSYHLDGSGMRPRETTEVFEQHGLVTFRDRLDFVQGASRERIPDVLRQFMDRVPAGRPFAVQVSFGDPHRSFDAPRIHDPKTLRLPPHFPDTDLLREDLAAHYDEIARLDSDIGTLRRLLEERGVLDNTVLIFMGDNGSAVLAGKGTLYEDGLKVPLIVRWPAKVAGGSVYGGLISGEDIAPTVLAIAGVEAPASMTGVSFTAVLSGSKDTVRPAAFGARGSHGSDLPHNSIAFDLGRAVVTPRYKLIYNALPERSYAPVDFDHQPFWRELVTLSRGGPRPSGWDERYFVSPRPMFELFDLEQDPYEQRNLAGDPAFAQTLRELKGLMHEWMILERDYVPLPIPPDPPAAAR